MTKLLQNHQKYKTSNKQYQRKNLLINQISYKKENIELFKYEIKR